MDNVILSVSDRGQVTIPNKIRKTMPDKHFTCIVKDGSIVLSPLKTREEFLTELDDIEKNWEKNGGVSKEEFEKMFNL